MYLMNVFSVWKMPWNILPENRQTVECFVKRKVTTESCESCGEINASSFENWDLEKSWDKAIKCSFCWLNTAA